MAITYSKSPIVFFAVVVGQFKTRPIRSWKLSQGRDRLTNKSPSKHQKCNKLSTGKSLPMHLSNNY